MSRAPSGHCMALNRALNTARVTINSAHLSRPAAMARQPLSLANLRDAVDALYGRRPVVGPFEI
jgi:hypothetical protein